MKSPIALLIRLGGPKFNPILPKNIEGHIPLAHKEAINSKVQA